MRQEDATPLFLTMERLPQDVAAGVARDVQLINLRDRVRHREMANATWWKGPIFDTWLRVAHYEREFPGSTSHGGVPGLNVINLMCHVKDGFPGQAH